MSESAQRPFVVVSNASPLIYAAQIQVIEILGLLYGQILIPDAVYQEIVVAGAGLAGSNSVRATKWIRRQSIRNHSMIRRFEKELDKGESEAIALGKEMNANLLLMDERKGRTIAAREGLEVTGILGILIEAKQKEFVPFVKPLLDNLFENTNFRGSIELYERVLHIAGE